MSARGFHSQILAIALVLLAGTATAFLSGCELPTKKNKRHTFNQTEDSRYAKDLTLPGPWICTLSISYSTSEKGVQDPTFVAVADDGSTVSKKLRESCAALDSAPREICENTFDAGQYSCANAAKFTSPYTEIAASVGHWTCQLPFSYVTAAPVIPKAKPIPAPSPSASPQPQPQPSPQRKVLQTSGETSTKAASLAFNACATMMPEAARESCALDLTETPSPMECWNMDLGKDARPRIKIRRTRH